MVIRQMILTYKYGGINRSFSDRLRLSVIFYYPANGNRSLAWIIEVLLYTYSNPGLQIPTDGHYINSRSKQIPAC
jgi:hypothetical protein